VRTAMESARAQLGGKTYSAADIAQSKADMARGLQAVQAGRYDEALQALRSAHAHNPLPEFLHNQAHCLEKLDAPVAAAALYRQFAEATPHANEASKARASAALLSANGANAPITASGLAGGMEWMHRGNQLLMAHKYNEAVAAFQEGFRTYPDSKFILNEAAALADGGRYAEADLAYQRYLSDPNAERADEARDAHQRLRTEHMGGREATITGHRLADRSHLHVALGLEHHGAQQLTVAAADRGSVAAAPAVGGRTGVHHVAGGTVGLTKAEPDRAVDRASVAARELHVGFELRRGAGQRGALAQRLQARQCGADHDRQHEQPDHAFDQGDASLRADSDAGGHALLLGA
jgi:tetratricopeptide (TPR) repeat protein